VERVAHPSLGLIVDSFHTLAIEDDLSELGRIPAERIFFVQVADAPRLKMDVLSWSRHFRCFPGQGQLDVPAFLAPLLASGYAGPLPLEIFTKVFPSAAARQTALDGMRSLRYLEEKPAERLPASPGPERRLDLFAPPAPARYRGFEFLEFAVDPTSEAELG